MKTDWKYELEILDRQGSRFLLSCPFCGAVPEIMSDGRRTWGLVEHNVGCLFPVFPKHEIAERDFTAWNRRVSCELMGGEGE